jgi:hypothetical protein
MRGYSLTACVVGIIGMIEPKLGEFWIFQDRTGSGKAGDSKRHSGKSRVVEG